jgi:signal transduction histidine kinase
MKRLGANPKEHLVKPAPGQEPGWWLGRVVDSLPIPALVIDPASLAVVAANEAARRLPLVFPEGDDPSSSHITDGATVRIGPERLGRDLIQSAAGTEGTVISWQTPTRCYAFRIYCRELLAADERPALALLTFVDQSQHSAVEVELRRALELRDEFFSIATHELKDPLFSLQLANRLLRLAAARQGEMPDYIQQHLDVSQRQTERLARFIDELLDVSRIMNRRLQLEVEPLDLSELAREIVARFRDRSDARGTTITAVAPEPVNGDFDRMKLEQVIANLLANAAKYGAGRPVEVRVRGDANMAVLEVRDQGVGIAREDQARIFERFERASTGHKKESLGLGLYIVRSLVEAHAGTIGVTSEPGEGATFTVRLPRNGLRDHGTSTPEEGRARTADPRPLEPAPDA